MQLLYVWVYTLIGSVANEKKNSLQKSVALYLRSHHQLFQTINNKTNFITC